MCDHVNMTIHTHLNSVTMCVNGKPASSSTVTTSRAYVACEDCGRMAVYEPTPSMPPIRIKAKAVAWFYMMIDGGAEVWLASLELCVARIKRKLELDPPIRERRSLKELLQQHEEEVEQIKNLIIMQGAK